MWILQNLLFILHTALSCVSGAAAVIHVFGYEGRDVDVSCSYDAGYESYEKYLCKNDCGHDADVLITSSQVKNNKYSIYDDKNKRVFTTTISDLSSVDAGKYWCGVTRTGKDYYPAEVRLKVVPDSCCDQFTKIHSYEEGSVSISCYYKSEDQNNLKYICRGTQPSTCLQQALITSDRKQKRRFTLTDDRGSRNFTVTITSLTQKDSEMYLCGVHRKTGLDVFSAVELEISPQDSRTVTSTITMEPVRSQSTHTPSKHTKDAVQFTLFFYILPAILAGLLILAIFLVWVYKGKCNKVQGVGVIMNINRSNEEMTVNDIYEIQENAGAASSNSQSLLHHNDNPGEDQHSLYRNMATTEDFYSIITLTPGATAGQCL